MADTVRLRDGPPNVIGYYYYKGARFTFVNRFVYCIVPAVLVKVPSVFTNPNKNYETR